MLKPLTRDYWPDSTRRPFVRATVAFLLAPLPVVGLFLLLAYLTMLYQTGDAQTALWRVRSFAPVVTIGCYVIMLSGGLIAFLLLWSFKLRGRLDYTIAGAIMGLLAAALTPLLSAEVQVSPPLYLVFAVVGVLMLLSLRWLAGVRLR